MNKKLVALAVAGVLAAPLAQAQTANVTLYGRVNLDVEFVNGTIYNKQRRAAGDLQQDDQRRTASRPIPSSIGWTRTRRASACAARNRSAAA